MDRLSASVAPEKHSQEETRRSHRGLSHRGERPGPVLAKRGLNYSLHVSEVAARRSVSALSAPSALSALRCHSVHSALLGPYAALLKSIREVISSQGFDLTVPMVRKQPLFQI